MGYLILLTMLCCGLFIAYKPFIDRTSNGSIVVWYNWKGNRIYKYLWKRNI